MLVGFLYTTSISCRFSGFLTHDPVFSIKEVFMTYVVFLFLFVFVFFCFVCLFGYINIYAFCYGLL